MVRDVAAVCASRRGQLDAVLDDLLRNAPQLQLVALFDEDAALLAVAPAGEVDAGHVAATGAALLRRARQAASGQPGSDQQGSDQPGAAAPVRIRVEGERAAAIAVTVAGQLTLLASLPPGSAVRLALFQLEVTAGRVARVLGLSRARGVPDLPVLPPSALDPGAVAPGEMRDRAVTR